MCPASFRFFFERTRPRPALSKSGVFKMPNQIDWEEMRIGYNRICGTHHRSVRAFVEAGCKRYGIQGFAEKLGVCGPSVDRIKKKLALNNQHEIWRKKRARVMELVESGKTKSMTVLEISEYAGYLALNTVYNMAKEIGFEYRHRWQKKECDAGYYL